MRNRARQLSDGRIRPSRWREAALDWLCALALSLIVGGLAGAGF